MRKATRFRKQITALALAAICALAPGLSVSAETATQDPAAEKMLAEQDAIDAAVEVADRYAEIITAAGETDQADLTEIEDLSAYAEETRALYEALEPGQQAQLAESAASFENAQISIDSLQDMLEQAERGEEIAPPDGYQENSWRYMNGEPIEEALQVVEEERAEVTGEEADGAVPTANVAMVRSGGKLQYMSLAEADAVQNVATASTQVYTGIDVSSWQGKIDWDAVKKSGIKFAILRCGRVFSGQTKWTADTYWDRNASECERLGIPYGAYVYSYAKDLSGVENEANKIIQAVKGYELSLPIFYDIEDNIQKAAAKKTPGILNDFAERFTDKVAAAGYSTGLYSSSSWLDDYCLDFAKSTKHYIWIARYNSSISGPNADNRFVFKGPFCAWQYSSSGTVPGISGDVDMNKWYGALKTNVNGVSADATQEDDKSYNGLVKASTGKWYYYTNGKIDKRFAGLAKGDRWYYVKNGTVDFSFTGIAKSPKNGKYYAVTKGVIESDTTGIAKNPEDGKWYFARNAVVDKTFTGFAKSLFNGKWYFVRKGVLDWKFTGVAKSVENGKWYFARKGALDWKFTGVAKSVKDGKWYYVRKGKLDWKYTGLGKSVKDGKWYYVKKGRLDWKYSGRVKYNKKWYRVKKGRVV